ncbi:MAG TPA: hypothetical protein VGV59_10920 [Pyrinomonadaceae bacterium]|nr:hypothetical protein [Pyrinomonadaceae bacterium]
MRCSSTAEFRKLKTCPTAEVLLLYKDARLASVRQRAVDAHLATCDFCGAELQLLSRHWTRSAVRRAASVAIEMPSNLRRLAEDILTSPSLNRARFIETLCELDRLTLTDA